MIDVEKRNQFWPRYYEWALDQWRQEVKSNFSLLDALENPACRGVVRILRGLPPEEQLRTGHLLAKRFHPEAVALLGGKLTPQDEEALQTLDQRRRLIRSWAGSASNNKVSRSSLKQAVQLAVEPVLGTDRELLSSSEWEYRTEVRGWQVSTKIEFPGQGVQMRYQHDISRSEEDIVYFADFLSAPSWFGVSSVCEWSDITDVSWTTIAGALALACRRFLEAMPEILPAW